MRITKGKNDVYLCLDSLCIFVSMECTGDSMNGNSLQPVSEWDSLEESSVASFGSPSLRSSLATPLKSPPTRCPSPPRSVSSSISEFASVGKVVRRRKHHRVRFQDAPRSEQIYRQVHMLEDDEAMSVSSLRSPPPKSGRYGVPSSYDEDSSDESSIDREGFSLSRIDESNASIWSDLDRSDLFTHDNEALKLEDLENENAPADVDRVQVFSALFSPPSLLSRSLNQNSTRKLFRTMRQVIFFFFFSF